LELHRATDDTEKQARTLVCLGRALSRSGQTSEAVAVLQDALRVIGQGYPTLACWALAALEESAGEFNEFRKLVRQVYEEPHDLRSRQLPCWVEPTELTPFERRSLHNEFETAVLDVGWTWEDPLADCLYQAGRGLEVYAANGRALWDVNLSAPRLIRRIESEEFAVQVATAPAVEATPSIGGILLWTDSGNFARLERGALGEHDVMLVVRRNGRDAPVGRGRVSADRILLRIERCGSEIRALCSENGEEWYSVGRVDFGSGEPPVVGLYGIGWLQREIHPGAFPEGSAIRFESFEIWIP
jgi:hypothetical protein